ncbi:MAG: hypothetical protein ACREMQ_19865, partial [Longimicrobiales bacterium]
AVPRPTIVLTTVNQGGTNAPVAINNVFGQIDIVADLDRAGAVGTFRVEWLLDTTEVCEQTFTTPPEGLSAEEAQAVPISCSVNTAAFNTTSGAVTFPNGVHRVSVRVVDAQGTVVATNSDNQFSNLTFNNTNFITAVISSSRGSAAGAAGPRSLAPVGSLWNAGDVTFTLLSVNYGATSGAGNQNLANLSITITTGGAGSNGVGACVSTNNAITDPTVALVDGGGGAAPLTDPTGTLPNCGPATAARTVNAPASGTFALTFPENAAMSAAASGVANVEDIFTVAVASVTLGGQAGPPCINPAPVVNPQGPLCGTFFQNPLRVDNLAPRITRLNIVRPNQYFNGQFVPSFAVTALGNPACPTVAGAEGPCGRAVDYGVNAQTTAGNFTFSAGPTATTLVNVTANFGPLPETVVAQTNLFQLSVRDALQNTRARFATATSTITSATAAGTLLFGIDNTAPTLTITAGPPDLSTNCPIPPSNPATPACAGVTQWIIAFTDAGIGPSGFNVNPVSVKLERTNSTGLVCVHPNTGATVSCTTNNGFVADDGTVNVPVTNAYYNLITFVTDAANNSSPQTVRLTLRDNVPPVAGGISSPATIVGGAPASFVSALTDLVELGDNTPYVTFGAGVIHLAEPRITIGTYGPTPLVTTDAGAVTIAAFIKSTESVSGAGLPTGTVSPATTFSLAVRDVAGVQLADPCPAAGAVDGSATQNCILRRVDITAAVATSNTFPAYTALNALNAANALHGLFTQAAPSAAIVCTLVVGNCTPAATPKSVTLTATVTGPAATFANPFTRVNFYWLDASGRYINAGLASVTITDNTVLNTRTITFTLIWTPAGILPPGAADFATTVIAVGVNAAGSALVSPTQPITLRQT